MSELSEARMMRIVDELAEAAQRVGLEVRREKIMREIGYRTRGGACRLYQRSSFTESTQKNCTRPASSLPAEAAIMPRS